jgi:type VI secretion system ImpC/EvpB family protein
VEPARADEGATSLARPGPGDPLAGPAQAGEGGPVSSRTGGDALRAFLRNPSVAGALARGIDEGLAYGPQLKRRIVRLLSHDVARIDALLNAQLNAILHHPAFQRLEAAWRGLRYLTEQAPAEENLKIRVLSVTWKELTRDLVTNAIDFDQSQLFRKVYSDEFGMPGGEPYGVLLGDYEIRHRPSPEHPVDDLGTLSALGSVAAAAFAPFVAGAHPALLELVSFTKLEESPDLQRPFNQLEYLKWKAFRDQEDSRFVGLALPRILLRLPYSDDTGRTDSFRFREDVAAPDRSQYLWGNAAFAFGSVLMRAFVQTGWLAAIRGTRRGVVSDGLVTGLPSHSFGTDRSGLMPKSSTDAAITDVQEKELSELGFIPLCRCQDTGYTTFYGNQSVQKPKTYDEQPATVNARLSAMLQYILCVSRIAHYIKALGRDRVGSYTGPEECQIMLENWLRNYTMSGDRKGEESRARYPLREARVRVVERPEKPGTYYCEIHLRPQYQLDQLAASLRLVTELAPSRRG